MKRLLLPFIVSSLAISAAAASNGRSRADVDYPSRPTVFHHLRSCSPKSAMMFKSRSIAGKAIESVSRAGDIRLDLDIKCAEGYSPLFTMYASDSSPYWHDPGIAETIDGIAPGTYTIVVGTRKGDGEPFRIYVEENLEVTESATLEIDTELCTELVSFKTVMPGGEEYVGPRVDDKGNVIDPGTGAGQDGFPGCMSVSLAHRKYGLILLYDTDFSILTSSTGTVDYAHGGNMLFNPGLSGDFYAAFDALGALSDLRTSFLVQGQSKGLTAQTVANATDFVYASPGSFFSTACCPPDLTIESKELKLQWTKFWNGTPMFMQEAWGDVVENVESIAYALTPADENAAMGYCVMPEIFNWWSGPAEEILPGLSSIPNYSIFPSAFRTERGKIRCVVTPQLDGLYGNNVYFSDVDGLVPSSMLDGDPEFSFWLDDALQPAGENVPYVYLCDYSGKQLWRTQWFPFGRLGESPVMKETWIHFSYADDELEGYYDIVKEDYWDMADQLNRKLSGYDGEVLMEVVDEGDFVIDGFDSRASVSSRWNYSQRDDNTVPMMTMLQFRNSDSKVTDRFGKAEDGRIAISAADYSNCSEYIFNEEGQPVGVRSWCDFTATPVVKVEYAPVGTGIWSNLPMTEDPSRFYMPGYGSYFSGSLEDITTKADKGWFDLRVSLSDISGNSSVYTVSPAFRIDDLSGVDGISPDVGDTPVEYYTLQGVRILRPAAGQPVIRRQGARADKVIY